MPSRSSVKALSVQTKGLFRNSSKPKANSKGKGAIQLRDYQSQAVGLQEQHRFTCVEIPTGGGKSIVQLLGSHLDHKRTGKLQIILVPTLVIAQGFSRSVRVEYGGKVVAIQIPDDNTVSAQEQAKVASLLRWYRGHRGLRSIKSHTYVATYATFLSFWEELSQKEKDKAPSLFVLRIDEGHHAPAGREDDEPSTLLGRVVDFLLNRRGSVHYTTATPGRADGPLFSETNLDSLQRLQVPFARVLNDNGIDKVHLFFVPANPENPLEFVKNAQEVVGGKGRRVLLKIPRNGSGWRKNSRYDYRSGFVQFMNDYESLFPKHKVLALYHNGKENREELDKLAQGQADYDVVMDCQKMKEGADCPPLSVIIDTRTPTTDLRLLVQDLGRLNRPGKQEIFYVFASYGKDSKDSFEAYSMAICLLDQILDEVQPVEVKGAPAQESLRDFFIERYGEEAYSEGLRRALEVLEGSESPREFNNWVAETVGVESPEVVDAFMRAAKRLKPQGNKLEELRRKKLFRINGFSEASLEDRIEAEFAGNGYGSHFDKEDFQHLGERRKLSKFQELLEYMDTYGEEPKRSDKRKFLRFTASQLYHVLSNLRTAYRRPGSIGMKISPEIQRMASAAGYPNLFRYK